MLQSSQIRKDIFSNDYLKLRKFGGVSTFQYIEFGFYMQICSAGGNFDSPSPGGVK